MNISRRIHIVVVGFVYLIIALLLLATLLYFVQIGKNAKQKTTAYTAGEKSTTPALSSGKSGGAPAITITAIGPKQLVIPTSAYNCPTNGHDKPDMPVHGFKDVSGKIHILATNSQGLQFIVDSWNFKPNQLIQNCATALAPQYDDDAEKTKTPAPESYSQKRWLTSTYTQDGQTVYAFVHNEFHGEDYPSLRNAGCDSGGEKCWWASISSYVSIDAGMTFKPTAVAPLNMIAAPWYRFSATLSDGSQSGRAGTAGHTNVVKGPDNFYYMYVNILAEQGIQKTGDMCLLRSSNLRNWSYWDGAGFTKQFADPYTTNLPESERTCATINAGFRTRTVVYNPEHNVFMAVFSKTDGYYYATSPDLIHWSDAAFLIKSESNDAVASLIDPESTSRSFDTVGKNPYVFIGRDVTKSSGEVWRAPLQISIP